MTRFQQFVVWAVIAALVLGMGLPLIAMGQQPRQPAGGDAPNDPRMVFSHYSKAIADKDFRAATNYLSPMSCRLMLILVATRMANTQPLAAGAERILTKHKAEALRDVPGTLDEVASVVENWSEKFGAIESPNALLAELAAFGDEKGMPVLNALPEGAVLRPNVAAERGQFAWAHHFVDFRGQQQQLRTICIKVDGQWKLLSFNHIFYLVAMQIHGYQISSPPAYDVAAYKRTRDAMHALEGPILAAVADGRLPGAAEAPSTIGLLQAIGRHNAPTDAVAQTNAGAELVDGWGRPLRYAVQGDTATLRSPGYDGQFDTDDDVVNAVKIGDTPGPDALPRVRLKTTKGDIVIELFEDDAPNAVANFLHLVEQGFYSGTKFHRIIDGFMAQGGDPNTRTGEGLPGTGGAGYSLPDEYTPNRTFDSAGVFAYANSGSDTSSSQFFITLGATPHLNDTVDPRSGRLIHYTIFGRVVEGMDVVQAIGKTPVAAAASGEPSRPLQDVTIRSAEVISKRNHSYPVRKSSE